MTEPLLTPADVAARLCCSTWTARQLMRFKLAHVRVGKLLRVRPEVLEKWIQQGGADFDYRPRAVSPEQGVAAPRDRSPRTSDIKTRLHASKEKKAASTLALVPIRGHRQLEHQITLPDGSRQWVSAAQWREMRNAEKKKKKGAAALEPAPLQVTVPTRLQALRNGQAPLGRRPKRA